MASRVYKNKNVTKKLLCTSDPVILVYRETCVIKNPPPGVVCFLYAGTRIKPGRKFLMFIYLF